MIKATILVLLLVSLSHQGIIKIIKNLFKKPPPPPTPSPPSPAPEPIRVCDQRYIVPYAF